MVANANTPFMLRVKLAQATETLNLIFFFHKSNSEFNIDMNQIQVIDEKLINCTIPKKKCSVSYIPTNPRVLQLSETNLGQTAHKRSDIWAQYYPDDG